MGQYYYVVNISKRQYLNPHKFGDGLKLGEFGPTGDGTMFGLAALLADGNNRGGGDIRSDDPLIGSWAGDRIVIAGDYADSGKFLTDGGVGNGEPNLHSYAEEHYRDISDDVIRVIAAAERWSRLAKLDLAEDGWRRAPRAV